MNIKKFEGSDIYNKGKFMNTRQKKIMETIQRMVKEDRWDSTPYFDKSSDLFKVVSSMKGNLDSMFDHLDSGKKSSKADVSETLSSLKFDLQRLYKYVGRSR